MWITGAQLSSPLKGLWLFSTTSKSETAFVRSNHNIVDAPTNWLPIVYVWVSGIRKSTLISRVKRPTISHDTPLGTPLGNLQFGGFITNTKFYLVKMKYMTPSVRANLVLFSILNVAHHAQVQIFHLHSEQLWSGFQIRTSDTILK